MKSAKSATFALLAMLVSAVVQAEPPQLRDRQTGKYLGNLSSNPYDANSVGNPYGKYGSEYSSDSINNPYGKIWQPVQQRQPEQSVRDQSACNPRRRWKRLLKKG